MDTKAKEPGTVISIKAGCVITGNELYRKVQGKRLHVHEGSLWLTLAHADFSVSRGLRTEYGRVLDCDPNAMGDQMYRAGNDLPELSKSDRNGVRITALRDTVLEAAPGA